MNIGLVIRKGMTIDGLKELMAMGIFPQEKRDFWYCGAAFDYEGKSEDLPAENFFALNPYRDSGGKVPEVGDIVPCMKKNGWIAFYEVTKKWNPHSWGDYALWDDGYYINLKLHHVERVK